MTDSYNHIFGDKTRIMGIFAHPDDAELYAGGTFARLVASGKQVRVVKMTSGGRGSRQENISESDLGKLRLAEDKRAMAALGIKPENNIYLGFRDGDIDNRMGIIEKVVFQIRQFQPEIILTHNPHDLIIEFDKDNRWINHRDHRHTGISVVDAAYPYSRDLLFFPEHFQTPGLKPGSVTEFLFVDSYNHPDEICIDINKFVDIRVKAHACHSSQYDLQAAQNSADFFTLTPDGSRRERFRYLVTD